MFHTAGNDLDVKPLPSGKACLLALAIGIFVPAVSAVIPIQRALSKNLNESINDQRSKNSGVAVKIFDSEKSLIKTFAIIGSIASFGCTTIYYYLPKAFL